MSLDTKKQIWIELAKDLYPHLNEDKLMGLSMEAANGWYLGEDTTLTRLFDQYVMLKNLKDL